MNYEGLSLFDSGHRPRPSVVLSRIAYAAMPKLAARSGARARPRLKIV